MLEIRQKFIIATLALIFANPGFGQFTEKPPGSAINDAARASVANRNADPEKSPSSANASLLSDTKGVDVRPYIATVCDRIRQSWYQSIHEIVSTPDRRQGSVVVEFTIARSGEISDVTVTTSSGQQDLDDAAAQGLKKASPVVPLPKALVLNELRMRFHFYYKRLRWQDRRY